jgi:hypothetical protein
MKVKMYECGDGVFTYDELKDADPMSEELKILDSLKVNESVSLGTSGSVRRIQ